MQATVAVEDYLKTIYQLTTTDGESATTSTIARRLGVSAPSVSAMVKRLEAGDLVTRSTDRAVGLTDNGRFQALGVIRRHRLLETFLAEIVGLPWDEVHDEAEILEHSLSDRLEGRIDELLGYPTSDPHGDPIPPRSGLHDERWADPLTAAPTGSRFQVNRVSDRNPDALRHLGDIGIRPGVVLDVGERAPFGGPLWISVAGVRHALGSQLTKLLHGVVLDEVAGAEASAAEQPQPDGVPDAVSP